MLTGSKPNVKSVSETAVGDVDVMTQGQTLLHLGMTSFRIARAEP